MKINRAEKGIHTIELIHAGIGYHDVQEIIEDLFSFPDAKTNLKSERFAYSFSAAGIDRTYESRYLSERGVRMELEQTISHPGRIRFIVNPSTFNNKKYDSFAIFKPKKDSDTVQKIIHKIGAEFGNWITLDGKWVNGKHRDWTFNAENVTLSRIDLTWNLWFDRKVDLAEVIRLFKKGIIPPKYEVWSFKGKGKDKEVNEHSFRIVRKSGNRKYCSLTVYDKGYEVSNRDPSAYMDVPAVLRIEISVFRKLFMSWFKETDVSNDEIMYEAYSKMDKLLRGFLEDIFPCKGFHLPYQKAERQICDVVEDNALQEKMLFLLKKTSKRNLGNAIKELEECYHLDQTDVKAVLLEFDLIHVNPVAFKKDCVIKKLRPFLSLFVEKL